MTNMELPKNSHQSKTMMKRNIKIGIIIFLVFLVIGFGCVFVFPTIKIKGKSVIELNVYDIYKDEGIIVKTLNKGIEDDLDVDGFVDNTKLGTYKITYKIKQGPFTTKGLRKVKVVDKVQPVITLDGDQEIEICPTFEFEEIGYKASDNYDKDITDKVTTKVSDEKVEYYVKDSSGNIGQATRLLKRVDNEKPTITLKGNSTIYVDKNSSYTDPGYEAQDNCDGNITSNVIVDSKVNTSVSGTYEVTYTVKDSLGNETKVVRTVYVKQEKVNIPSGTYKSGMIYLTFDDGPSNVTSQILDILNEKGVKATFFVINTSDNYNHLIKREYDEGHTVALHSYTHNYANIYSSVDSYWQDLNKISDKVHSITGQSAKIIRFPGGSSNTISRHYSIGIMSTLSNEVLSRGYHYFDWNVDCGDAGGARTSDTVYKNVVNNLSHNKTNVVLMHDFNNNYITVNALRNIIDYGLNNGYTFASIDMETPMVTHRILN